MTRLLEQAFTTVSTSLSHEGQDRLARLLLRNPDRIEEILETALDEQIFEASAVEAIESEKVQTLLRRVAEKHVSMRKSATHPG